MNYNAINQLSSYIDALYPIIYINNFDFTVVDSMISYFLNSKKIIEFNNTLGITDFAKKNSLLKCDLKQFLDITSEEGFNQDTIFVLKDIHKLLKEDIQIITYLKNISEKILYNDSYHATIIIVSNIVVIPHELEDYITLFDMPLPTLNEIPKILREFSHDLMIDIDDDVIDELSISLKGLNEFQIRQILNLAYQDGGYVDRSDKKIILTQKQQITKKSGMLEIINFSETINDIGGLENLKDWLKQKAKIFSNLDKAIKFGVDIPKGIMLFGMPGCAKSLVAKATANLFEIPLVRLDVGRLLGKYVGESEENMRKALKVAEAISPCVLWVDEIEKAFAGINESTGNAVTIRLFGQFLTWLQEKDNTVFIVATANDISKLPPEFLRKGRFDELFFVDLPNDEERRNIIEIHLKKRNKWNKNIDTIALMKSTEGFSGADLEYVVKDAIEHAFINNKYDITTNDLLNIIKDTKSISNSLKTKIDEINDKIKNLDIKRANKEN